MTNYQGVLFNWAQAQGGMTALVLIGLGVTYLFMGFRFARFLMGVSAAALAYGSALLVAPPADGAPELLPLGVGAVAGLIALTRTRPATILVSIASCAALGFYLPSQLGLPLMICLPGMAVGAILGLSLHWLAKNELSVMLTTLHGAVLLVVGFVAMTHAALPSMSATFVTWSDRYGLIVPGMMTMLIVTGYAFQANARQGDMETGQGRSWNAAG